MWNQWKLFEKMTKDLNSDYFVAQNWVSEAHIPHTTESTWNEHVKQYMWNQWKLFEKVTIIQNFDLLWGPKWLKNWDLRPILYTPMRKKLATMTAHGELTVTKMVTASCDWVVTWAVIELWPSRNWAVIILKMPWLSCDLAVTELWPSRDWSVTSPSRDWAVIIGPRSRDCRGHCELTVSSRWPFIFSWASLKVSPMSI